MFRNGSCVFFVAVFAHQILHATDIFRITRETYSDAQGVKTAEDKMLPVFLLFAVGAIFFDTLTKDSPARSGPLILTVECRRTFAERQNELNCQIVACIYNFLSLD